jgi:enoyl-CoA hydratase/carnithine racemase
MTPSREPARIEHEGTPVNAPNQAHAHASLERHDDARGVATLTLNRPAQFNALDAGLLEALERELVSIGDDPRVRVVVVAGAGRAFCPGHDLKQMLANCNEPFIGSLFRRCCDVMLALQRIPQPVIAKVHGIATAAGCQLVAACDLAVASADARFATSGINFGLFCATPGVAVARNVPRKRAFEMLFTGEFIDAATAAEWGLVNRVVPAAELDAATAALADAIVAKPAAVVALGKRFFYRQLEERIDAAYALAADTITSNMLGPDAREGVGAFVEKRPPRWRT